MPKLLLFFTVVLLLTAGTAASEITERAERIEAAWQFWANSNDIGQTAIAVSYNGKIVLSSGINRSANDRVPIASLSKAITGICIQKYLDTKELSLSDTIGDIFDGYIAGIPMPAGKSRMISVQELLTHSTGLNDDITQGRMHLWRNSETERLLKTSIEVLEVGTNDSTVGQYFYNNSNYAILGSIVAKLSGDTYERACEKLVLVPVGIEAARLSTKWRALSSFGGWELSAVDYLRFIIEYFGSGSKVGSNPYKFANHNIGDGAYYGMGVLFRTNRQGLANFWHFGALCFGQDNSRDDLGSFFASWGGSWAVSVNYNKCLNDDAAGELDDSLWRAAHQ